MLEIKKKIEKLIKKRNLIPDEFWIPLVTNSETQVIWILDQEDGTAGSYETSQERIGITKEGKVIWGFSSGCSCWSGWEKENYCETKSAKEFDITSDFLKLRADDAGDWEKLTVSNLDGFLFLVSPNPDPSRVLAIENSEIRRYMIKRVGYENIKNSVEAEVLHKDGDSELLKFKSGELYVKVKDSSTEREYLLYVEGDHKTCRSAIAWTFGLTEEEYQPTIET